LIVVARGQGAIMWFSLLALLGIVVLSRVGQWYGRSLARAAVAKANGARAAAIAPSLPRRRVIFALAVLITLVFSKYFYLACISSYYTFFLIGKFGLSVKSAQLHLFLFWRRLPRAHFSADRSATASGGKRSSGPRFSGWRRSRSCCRTQISFGPACSR
jgi:hypothetical protein